MRMEAITNQKTMAPEKKAPRIGNMAIHLKSFPPRAWVFRQTSSFERVQGVRMPIVQFGSDLPIKSPAAKNTGESEGKSQVVILNTKPAFHIMVSV